MSDVHLRRFCPACAAPAFTAGGCAMVAPGAKGSFPLSTEDATNPKNIIALSNPHTITTGFQGTRIYIGRTSEDEGRLTITTIVLRKTPDISWTSYPLRTGLSPFPLCWSQCAPKPHPVAAFGCKVFKYLLCPRETLQDRPGSNLLTTRRFTRMAGRNSRYHHTLKRGLEQCSPTLKSATFSRSISSLRN
jgi:hypothetical protein